MSMHNGSGSSPLKIAAITPTVFFVRTDEGVKQAVDITLANGGEATDAQIAVRFDAQSVSTDLAVVESGEGTHRIYIPDIREPIDVAISLLVEGQVQDQRTMTWAPMRHWEIYMVHGSHHDLGYTDLPSNVLREHDEFLDDVVRFCEQTADWPEDSKFRYVVEQGWSVLHYVENRPTEAVERLASLMCEGRIEVTALFGNETSELCGDEEQIRLTYPSFRLKRRFGIPIRTAELNDVPGLSWGLVSVLAGAGIRYFAPRIPDYFRWGYTVHPFWDEDAVIPRDMSGAFWWEGVDGSRVLFWYGGRGTNLWTYDQASRALPELLDDLEQRGYEFDQIRYAFQGGGRDNAPPDVRLSLIAREWNSRWAYPRLLVATNMQFFERLEQAAGDRLRVLRGELPNTDYTVGAASTAKVTGVNRLAHDTLVSGEKMASCATLVSDYDYPADTLAEAYDAALLFDEHTWGLHHPLGPAEDGNWSQKSQYAYRAAALSHDVLLKSTNRITDQIRLVDDAYHVVVYNALAHERTDVVRVPARTPSPCGMPMHWRSPDEEDGHPAVMASGTAVGRSIVNLPLSLLEQPFEVVDLATGESIPHQVVSLNDPLAARELAPYRYGMLGAGRDHRLTLVFVAKGVPSLGYKTYRVSPVETPPVYESDLRMGDYTLENRFYKVALDPETGAIASIFDKELQREWVDADAPQGFNQVLIRSAETGEVTTPARSTILEGEKGPVLASLIAKGEMDAPLLACPQRTQEITLYRDIKRIDLATRLLKDATPLVELYVAFPFATQEPRFLFQASNTVVSPIVDQLPGSNTDAYAVQHWVGVSDEGGGATWCSREAPVAVLGNLWPGYVSQAHHGVTPPGYGHEFLHDPAELEKGHIYSFALVSNFRTNFQPVQSGDMLFRYSLRTHSADWSQGQASGFGAEVANPLLPVSIRGVQQGSLDPVASFCQVSEENVAVLTIKAAEDGDGIIVRLAERDGRDTLVTVTLPHLGIEQALLTNLVEENQETLWNDRHTVALFIKANGIATVRCRGSRRWPVSQSVAWH